MNKFDLLTQNQTLVPPEHNSLNHGVRIKLLLDIRALAYSGREGKDPFFPYFRVSARRVTRSHLLYALGKYLWKFLKEALQNLAHNSHCLFHVHSCQQKFIGLKFSKSQTGSDVRYSCRHISSRFTFPIFAHSCRFSVLYSLQ